MSPHPTAGMILTALAILVAVCIILGAFFTALAFVIDRILP